MKATHKPTRSRYDAKIRCRPKREKERQKRNASLILLPFSRLDILFWDRRYAPFILYFARLFQGQKDNVHNIK